MGTSKIREVYINMAKEDYIKGGYGFKFIFKDDVNPKHRCPTCDQYNYFETYDMLYGKRHMRLTGKELIDILSEDETGIGYDFAKCICCNSKIDIINTVILDRIMLDKKHPNISKDDYNKKLAENNGNHIKTSFSLINI